MYLLIIGLEIDGYAFIFQTFPLATTGKKSLKNGRVNGYLGDKEEKGQYLPYQGTGKLGMCATGFWKPRSGSLGRFPGRKMP